MKLAHVALVTPGMCGLYETTRELVAAERALGHDARIFDPAPTVYYPKDKVEDRGALLAGKDWLAEVDVIFDHSGCDGSTDELQTPHVLICHGRPDHSFVGEIRGSAPVWSYHHRINRTDKYKAVVTFWEQHLPFHQLMFPRKSVHVVPSPVDLGAWTPDGPSGYGFHGKRGKQNIVICDAWRDDGDMLNAVTAAGLAARAVDGTKIHIFGKQGESPKGWPAIFSQLKEDDTLGEVCGWVKGLDNVYRAADVLVTPHAIDTRAVREALACGCPVVRACGDIDEAANRLVEVLEHRIQGLRRLARLHAEINHDGMEAAKTMIHIAEGCL